MNVQILTVEEAEIKGFVSSMLYKEGYGAFGEPEHSYRNCVCIGGKVEQVFYNELIIATDKEVLQVICESECSDELLKIFNNKLLEKRKKQKFENYLKLKKEIDLDEFYDKLKTK